MHKYIKGTWLEAPAFLVFLLACWYMTISIMAIVRHFLGSWGMILTMPIYWYYIIGPILDEMWEWFENRYI